MKLDRLCAAKKFQYYSTRFNILFYTFATIQTVCTVLCTIIYTAEETKVFGDTTRVIGLIVSYTASVISAFLLIVPPVTRSPSAFSTGTGSPVIILSSIEE